MADRFDRFTKRARRVLTLAQNEARKLNHNYIGTEHILLGLISEKNGLGFEILKNLSADPVLIRYRVEQLVGVGHWHIHDKLSLTEGAKKVIELTVDETRRWGHHYIGTEHLLVGLLREDSGLAGQVLSEMGISLDQVRIQLELIPKVSGSFITLSPKRGYKHLPISISPIFIFIVLITVAAAYLVYQHMFNPNLTVFVFVTGGWLISLCLHEFGHAIIAFLGGDREVIEKGYLTLNPLKYTHSILSIVLPLIYLAIGGLGLPGGAVYINPGAIRSKGMRSLTSAAGPIATGICSAVLLVPFVVGWVDINVFDHFEFWAGLALLTSLQITALIFNLLPIPGLDGFGIIEPYLPNNILSGIRGFGPYTLVIIFVLFSNQTFSRGFWSVVRFITTLFNLDFSLVYVGLDLFQFWLN